MDPLKQDNEPLWTTLKNDVIRLFLDPKKVIAVEAGEDAAGSVGVTTVKLVPMATQVQDSPLVVYQSEYDACFKGVPLEQHMREAFASCAEGENQKKPTEDGAHFFKPIRDAVTALQRCAATMAVVPGGEGSEKMMVMTRSVLWPEMIRL